MSKGTASALPASLLRAVPSPKATWAQECARLEQSGTRGYYLAAVRYQERASEGASTRHISEQVGLAGFAISHMTVARRLRALEGCNVTLQPTDADLQLFATAYAGENAGESPAVLPQEPGPIPEGTYRTVVADPPWQYDNRGTRGAVGRVAPGKRFHYDTMSIEDICALADTLPAADDAHLYLWTTNSFLRPAFDVMDAWGFEYKTCLTWVKPQIGLGNYFRNSTEHVLFGVRGKLATRVNNQPTAFEAKRGKHSAKPEVFSDLVEAASPGPYLELFSRDKGQLWKRDGWTYWGNEA